jgi:hypothetical protein
VHDRVIHQFTPKEKRTIEADGFISLKQFRPVAPNVLLEESSDVPIFKGSILSMEKRYKQPKISSRDDLIQCVVGMVAAEAILCPRKAVINAGAVGAVMDMCESFDWKYVLNYIESVRSERV